MNQVALTSLLMSGWIPCHPQCKNVGEAAAWMEASSETTKAPAKETQNSLSEVSANERSEGEDDDNGDEQEEHSAAEKMEDSCGSPVKTETDTEYCNRDGLYYRSYSEKVAARKRQNKQRLGNLGLLKAKADLKAATVTPPNIKRKSAKKKVPPTKVRRSTRAPTDIATDHSEAEEVENEEDEDEEASDPEDEEQEDRDDSEKDEDEEDENGETPCDEDATTATQMGRWGAQFLKLIAYKEEHGHCNVVQRDSKNKSLGLWVKKQRHSYKKWKNGNKTPMTEKRIVMLERIGFNWGKPRSKKNVPWAARFEELKEHDDTYGKGSHKDLVLSDYKKCSALGKWISWQRKRFHLSKSGCTKIYPLKKEQIKLLNGIQFDWNGPYYHNPNHYVEGTSTG